MTKEHARKLLEYCILKDGCLPVWDKVFFDQVGDKEYSSYTFRGLLEIAYELECKQTKKT